MEEDKKSVPLLTSGQVPKFWVLTWHYLVLGAEVAFCYPWLVGALSFLDNANTSVF